MVTAIIKEEFSMARTVKDRLFSLFVLMLAICMLAACSAAPAVTPTPEMPESPAPAEPTPGAEEIPEVTPEEPTVPAVPAIGGLAVDALSVIYPAANANSESDFAQSIADAIAEAYGISIPVIPDDVSASVEGGKILVGGCTGIPAHLLPAYFSSGESLLTAEENIVLVSGADTRGLYGAVNEFISRIKAAEGKDLELPLPEVFTAEHGDAVRVMTFNLLISNKTLDRVNRVKKMITNYMPDSFGVQEANIDWIISLLGYFTEVGAPYDVVAHGNDGGNDGRDITAIFYRTDKYTVLDSGIKWLSDTPDTPSMFSGSQVNRTVTYAILQEIATGKTYVHLNTHLDTNYHLDGKTRDQQAMVLIDFAEQFKEYPMVITGDFNARPTTVPVKAMLAAGYCNPSETAPDTHGYETFHDYGTAAAGAVIDYCFMNPVRMAAVKYRVCDEKIDGDYPSDHHPVFVDFIYW